jgi:uncharacterized membrane protein/uncharacterized membrane protein YeaQ/YmgE (transglycosylase-associated protein family)
MHVVIWLLIGTAVGGIAHFVGRGPRYPLFGALSLGMLGSVLSGWIFWRLGVIALDQEAMNAVVAVGGALVAIGAVRLLLRASKHLSTDTGLHSSAATTLEGHVARLGALERRILSKFLQHQPIACDCSVEFDRQLGFGDRLADRVAAFGGSWSFIGLSSSLLIAWMIYNSKTPGPFDPYPFLLLNLALNCIGALQAPVIMMSQNRLAARDRFHARNDYEVNLKAEMEIMALHSKLDELREQEWKRTLEMQDRQLAALGRIERVLGERATQA